MSFYRRACIQNMDNEEAQNSQGSWHSYTKYIFRQTKRRPHTNLPRASVTHKNASLVLKNIQNVPLRRVFTSRRRMSRVNVYNRYNETRLKVHRARPENGNCPLLLFWRLARCRLARARPKVKYGAVKRTFGGAPVQGFARAWFSNCEDEIYLSHQALKCKTCGRRTLFTYPFHSCHALQAP